MKLVYLTARPLLNWKFSLRCAARKGVATFDLQPQRARANLRQYVEACGSLTGCDTRGGNLSRPCV